MKKLSLKLDELQVETFEPEKGPNSGRGTVNGQQESWDTCPRQWTCDGTTCGRVYTNEGTCDNTCGQPYTCGYNYCGTYPEHGCPNSQWFCTNCRYYC